MKKIFLLLFFLIFSFDKNLLSEDDVPFILNAEKIVNNHNKSIVTATGNVEIIQGKEVLRADYLEFDKIKNKAIVKGNVSILDEDGVVYFADYAEVDKGFRNGLTKNISILFPDNSKMAASNGRRFKGTISTLKKALYSACNCDDPNKKPTWQIKASEVVHDSKRKKISYKNAFLEFLGFPVAYTPYYSHPDPSVKRQSGFLFPSYTSNSELGTIIRTPYYYALSPYKDLTIEPMYISGQRPLMYAQYRQRFNNGELGIEGSFTNADRRTRVATYSNKTRGHLFINGKFDHNDFWRYGFNVKRSTDDTYLSRYMFSGATDRLHSDFFIEGFDDRNYFYATGIATQVQSSTYESRKTPLVLPSINYNYQSEKTKIGFVDFNASFLSLTRRQGADTRKVSLQPIITYPFQDNFGNRFKVQAKTTLTSYMVSHVKRTLSKNKPTAINFEIDLTNGCNHRCSFCQWGSYLEYNRATLKSQIVVKALPELIHFGTKAITWTGGGEPTVHKDFFKILEKSYRLGLDNGLLTNGSLLKEKYDSHKYEYTDNGYTRVPYQATRTTIKSVDNDNG